jgi:tetratricopeptide (TPR) repeat protein
LREFVQLLAGHRIDAGGGLTALDSATLSHTWKKLQKRNPEDFTIAREAVGVWHREEARDAEKAGDWFALGFHLDFLIRAHPDDWRLQARRASAHIRLRQWSEAAGHFAKAIKLGSNNSSVWYGLALVQLQLGKTEEYRRTCAGMLKHFGKTKDAQVAQMLISACTLVGDAHTDWGVLVELAEKHVAAKAPNQPLSAALLGMALYRAGRFEEAAAKLKYSFGSQRLFLVMAQCRLNRKEEARRTLDQLLQRLESDPSKKTPGLPPREMAWNQKLQFRLLRQESEAMMKGDKD